jgi:hypothetical protein
VYRHELRFVLRFGVRREFDEFARQLSEEEVARGWTPPQIWQAISGHVNRIVIEHDYASVDAFRRERGEFHDDPGAVGEVLGRLAVLAVPGTAVQFELDGITTTADV